MCSRRIDRERLTSERDRREGRLDAIGEADAAIVFAHFGGGIGHPCSPRNGCPLMLAL